MLPLYRVTFEGMPLHHTACPDPLADLQPLTTATLVTSADSQAAQAAGLAASPATKHGAGGYHVTHVIDWELLTAQQQQQQQQTQLQHYAIMQSICAMQENRHKSVEEMRFEAYAKAGEPALNY